MSRANVEIAARWYEVAMSKTDLVASYGQDDGVLPSRCRVERT